MFQRGIVSAIEDNRVWISALSEKDEEGSCQSGGCGSGCSCNVTGQLFRAMNTRDLPLKPGDKVEVTASGSSVGWGVLLVLGLPVFLALAGWFGLPRLLTMDSQPWMALTGGALGIVLALLFGRVREDMPEVYSILS